MNKGTIRYPGVKSIYAILAKNFNNVSQFNDTNKIEITLDTGILEITNKDSESGNTTEEYVFVGKIAGISTGLNFPIDNKYILKLEFFYSTETLTIGKKDFPAILTIQSTTGQTAGNFIGKEITFTCLFPTCRHSATT